jgi:hypothetical protein
VEEGKRDGWDAAKACTIGYNSLYALLALARKLTKWEDSRWRKGGDGAKEMEQRREEKRRRKGRRKGAMLKIVLAHAHVRSF